MPLKVCRVLIVAPRKQTNKKLIKLKQIKMSIYICTICNNQKDGDFNCAELDGEECCEECFEEKPEDFGVDLEEEMRISSDEAFRIGRDC